MKLTDIDIGARATWELEGDIERYHGVILALAKATRYHPDTIYDLLRSGQENDIESFVSHLFAFWNPRVFEASAPLRRYLHLFASPPLEPVPAELPRDERPPQLISVGISRDQTRRFNTLDSDVALDVLTRLCAIIGLSVTDFAFWQLCPPGSGLKTSPNRFDGQVASFRNVYIASTQIRC